MMGKVHACFMVCMVLAWSLSIGPLAGKIYAEEHGESDEADVNEEEIGILAEELAVNQKLLGTTIITNNNSLSLDVNSALAFTAAIFALPAGTFTLTVDVSAEFCCISSGSAAAMRVSVDGSPVGVSPSEVVTVDSGVNSPDTQFYNVRTFSWMKKGLTAGIHRVEVSFHITPSGGGSTRNRTLTLRLYKS
jgi:hypothetical protein